MNMLLIYYNKLTEAYFPPFRFQEKKLKKQLISGIMTEKKSAYGKNYARKKLYKMGMYSLCWEGLVNSLYTVHVLKRTISSEQRSTLLFRFVCTDIRS